MKKIRTSQKTRAIFIITITLFFAGCYEFQFIQQPIKADLNSSFEVPISVQTTDGDSTEYYRSYFTVQLPEDWTISDSIYYNDETQNGYFIYSDSITEVVADEMETDLGYKWMSFKSSDSILFYYNANFYFTPVFHTGNIAGTYFIDYYLGDNTNGVVGGFECPVSLNNPISVGSPDTVIVTNNTDEGTGTLRHALDSVAWGGLITFDLDKAQTIGLNYRLSINKDVRIKGPDQFPVTVSMNDANNNVITIRSEVNLEIANLNITDGKSYYGAGIHMEEGASLTANNIVVVNNVADNNGGGIYCNRCAKLDLKNVTIASNHSGLDGGGLYLYNTYYPEFDFKTDNVVFQNNTASGNGGGIAILYSSDTIMIKNTAFITNEAVNGGGIYSSGGSIGLLNSWFEDNVSEYDGGGLYIREADLTSINTLFENNKSYRGGGIYSFNSDLEIINSLIVRNKSSFKGGGLFCKDLSNAIITNSTFSQNTAYSEGGSIMCSNNVIIFLKNGIHYLNQPDEINLSAYNEPCQVSVSYTNLEGGEEGIVTNDNGILNWLEGNIDEDPLFVYSVDFPYQINDYSPCIDAGTPDTFGLSLPEFDLAGEIRVFNDRVDMGAYEWNTFVDIDEFEIGPEKSESFMAYPNPATDRITLVINSEANQMGLLTIIDHYGKMVKPAEKLKVNPGQNYLEIDLSDLLAGLYFLNLQVENKTVTKKIVKL